MWQGVQVTRLADRHAGPARDFATSWQLVVEEGPLSQVLRAVADAMEPTDTGPARHHIIIEEPHCEEA